MASSVFTCTGALGTPAEWGPSLESIHRISLKVDLCEGNKIISFKEFISPEPVGGPQKEKKYPGALGTCPVCPVVKTALGWRNKTAELMASVGQKRPKYIISDSDTIEA